MLLFFFQGAKTKYAHNDFHSISHHHSVTMAKELWPEHSDDTFDINNKLADAVDIMKADGESGIDKKSLETTVWCKAFGKHCTSLMGKQQKNLFV